MKTLLQFLLVCLLLFASTALRAQVGVGTTTPDSKAALDIQAADKGLLIPRLTAGQRTGIANPPQGLMVYQTDGTPSGGPQTGFWYYAGAPAQWVFLNPTPNGGGLTLPYAGTANVSGGAFTVTNTAFDSEALSGTATNDDAAGVVGRNTSISSSLGIGVKGTSRGGTGVSGTAFTSGVGVAGESVSGTGIRGSSSTGIAVLGDKPNASNTRGRVAQFTNASVANDSTAVYISTPGDRPALRAVNTATSGQAAIRGVKQAAAPDGIGVEGVITSGASGNAAGVLGHDRSGSGTGSGVIGLTAGGYGVRGIASANGGYGVSGSATNSYGVIGSSQTGSGVYGSSNAAASGGRAAVVANNTNIAGVGVRATTAGGVGVLGETTGPGDGVSGQATTGSGVTGSATSGAGVYGSSNTNSGVYGATAASGSGVAGVEGTSSSSSGTGVLGTTTSGYGVRGISTGSSGYGVFGSAAASNGIGVYGSATGAATAVYGLTTGTGRAAYFGQNNASSSAAAVQIVQSGTGPALEVTGGPVRTAEVTTPPTGSANMLPAGYGLIAGDGTIRGGSGNFTVTRVSYGIYEITFTSASRDVTGGAVLTSYVASSGGGSGQNVLIRANGSSRRILVNVVRFYHNTNGSVITEVPSDVDFSFVVFAP